MPHKCVRCTKTYPDGSKELLKGCECGSKFFFFVKNLKKVETITKHLDKEDRFEIERDITEIIGEKYDEDLPIIIDLESINVKSPGKFKIDIVKLFKGEPVVYKLEEGKYIIDVATTFHNLKKE
tara:strand:- start:93 stop:464 length:372 start_codon:yes stop_codon:yes gene_type:complete